MALLYQSLQNGLEEELYATDAYAAAAAAGLNSADDTLPYSTSELNAPEYSSDDFRMFQFKVARCSKRYVHDWRACPFAHPTENARRRDPRLVKYLPVPCPDYKRGICLRGDACTYSHGVYECWLHPAKYRTQLCKEGPNCRRPVCFFAHTVKDLRQPSHMFDASAAGADDGVLQSAAGALGGPHAGAVAAGGRPSTDAAFARLSSDEVMNNIQGGDGNGLRSAAEAAAAASATAAAQLAAASPSSRQSSGSLAPSSGSGSGSGPGGGMPGSSPHSPSGERSGSPNSPGAGTADLAGAAASDAAAAMAVLTQQQQAQAQAAAAQAAAAIARLSMDGRASLDASAAAATTQAMLGGGGPAALPPRMSLDSLLASRQAGAGWSPAAAPPVGAPTAAGMLANNVSTLPLNEQPFPPGNAPRMSNAVARKLGLAPQRASLDARLGKLRGGATPPRTSLDGILHALQQSGARSSLDQQQVLHAMNPQLAAAQAMAQLNGGGAGMPPQLGAYGGAGPSYGGAPHGYAGGHGMGAPGAEGMGLHPALLNLVAAQMAPQHVQGGMVGMPPPGVPNGMHSGLGSQHGGDPSMAALMDSLNGWQLGGGGGMQPRAASMDSGMGMAGAQGLHHGRPPLSGAYYEAKGIWGSQEAINNQAGSES